MSIVFEDSRLRLLLHALINCHTALYGYSELGELDKAIAMTHECQGALSEIRTEIEKMKADEQEG